MKDFLKTILIGFEVILLSATSVINIVSTIIILANLHKMTGWQVLVFFIISLFILAMGIALMWVLGKAVIDDKEENNEEEIL